ncbi:P-loop domain-containing protein [Streptomyces anulatus]|uniref:AAA family ATPase n=1 Tax=Streptomyces anulatus TaxID=1892 RepID=UPI003651E8F4
MAGLSVVGGSASLDPDYEMLRRLWRGAREGMEASEAREALIVHFAGHGIPGPGDQSLFLATRETNLDNYFRTAEQVATWLGEAEAFTDGPPVLFLLDVCGAGRPVVQQLTERIRAADRRAWVIAACAPDEKTYGARFTSATGTVVERLSQGRLDISPTVKHVPVETLAREIDRELARSAAAEVLATQSVLRTAHAEARVPVPPFLLNPSYRASAGDQFLQSVEMGLWQFAAAVDPALDPLHFISRASGTPQQQDIAQGCFFTGRKQELGKIKQWLEGPSEPTLMVVTGSPGSGKSALLGVVACLAHPQLRSVTHQVLRAVDREVRPERNPDLAAVHARQRGPAEVLASIAAQLDLGEEPGRGWTATAVLDRITEQRTRPVTVVVDALDEASSDSALVEVLIQLAQSRRQRDEKDPDRDRVICRVLVGTRPWWDRYGVLLKELKHSDQLVDLDQVSVKQRTQELTDYLCEILETSPLYSGPGAPELRVATATAVAKRLGRRQEAGFLLASLFAHYLVHQDAAPSVAEVVQRIPLGLPDMLRLHLDILQAAHPTMAGILAAVAHGYGQGMPLEVVTHVASAFLAPGSKTPSQDDVRKALTAAAFYLRFSTDSDGQRLYRFYHQSLVDYQRELFERVSRSDILTSVLDTLPGPADVGTRRFGLALPYVLRHAAQHAAEAGALDMLLSSASFLVHCDPQLLREVRVSRSLRGRITGLMCQTALSVGHEPWHRRMWLRATAMTWGEPWLVEALDGLEEPTAQPPEHRLLQFSWGTVEVPAPYAGWSPDFLDVFLVQCSGRWLAVGHTVGDEVEVWDVRTGAYLFSLSHPGEGSLTALCGKHGRFGSLVAVGRADGYVEVWDLERGSIKAKIQTDAVPVVALGIVEEGHSVRVVACGGGEVTAYDLEGNRVASLDLVGDWLLGLEANGGVEDLQEPDIDIKGYDCTAVAAVAVDGTQLYVSGASNGSVHVWEAAGRNLIWAGGSTPVFRVQTAHGSDGPIVVTSADDGTRIWDVHTGTHRLLDGVDDAGAGAIVLEEGRKLAFAYFKPGCGILARSLDGEESVPALLCAVPEEISGLDALAVEGSSMAAVAWGHHGAGSLSWHEGVLLSQSPHARPGSLMGSASHTSAVDHVAVAKESDSRALPAVSVETSEEFHVWDSSTGTLLTTGSRPGITATAVGRMAETKIVALAHGFGTDHCIELINADTGESVGPLIPWESVLSLSFEEIDRQTTLVVNAADGVGFLSPGEEEPREWFPTDEGDYGRVRSFALWRRAEELLAVASHGWSLDYPDHWSDITHLVRHTASGESRLLAKGDEITCLAAGQWDSADVAFTGGVKGTIVVRCLETGQELARFHGHDGEVTSALFTKVEQTAVLVTCGADSFVRVWDCSQRGLLLNATGFPDLIGAVDVNDTGVFVGFGARVAFFAWTDLCSVAGSNGEAGNR